MGWQTATGREQEDSSECLAVGCLILVVFVTISTTINNRKVVCAETFLHDSTNVHRGLSAWRVKYGWTDWFSSSGQHWVAFVIQSWHREDRLQDQSDDADYLDLNTNLRWILRIEERKKQANNLCEIFLGMFAAFHRLVKIKPN